MTPKASSANVGSISLSFAFKILPQCLIIKPGTLQGTIRPAGCHRPVRVPQCRRLPTLL